MAKDKDDSTYEYDEEYTYADAFDSYSYPSTKRKNVAELRETAKEISAQLENEGYVLEPVESKGRKIATTFWGQSWCRNIEDYQDYFYRLPRGRSYLKHGTVVDLKIKHLKVNAMVSGGELYDVEIEFKKIKAKNWKYILEASDGNITEMAAIFAGQFSYDFMQVVCDQRVGAFPSPSEIKMSCTCLDDANVCKHVAAVLYGIGVRLDYRPELFFVMRGVDPMELIQVSEDKIIKSIEVSKDTFDAESIESLFGIEVVLDGGKK